MASDGCSRRLFVAAGALTLAGRLTRPGMGARAAGVAEIRMISRAGGAEVRFDPIGLRVEPGTTVRWLLDAGVHTTTAYHPAHERPLRIPAEAEAWDSGYLTEPGADFAVILEAEGVYDFFCRPHEAAGMVGRIVVGQPAGPAMEPPGDALPAAARGAFPGIEEIMAEGEVRAEESV